MINDTLKRKRLKQFGDISHLYPSFLTLYIVISNQTQIAYKSITVVQTCVVQGQLCQDRKKNKKQKTKKNFCMWFRQLLVKMRKTITHYGFRSKV